MTRPSNIKSLDTPIYKLYAKWAVSFIDITLSVPMMMVMKLFV